MVGCGQGFSRCVEKCISLYIVFSSSNVNVFEQTLSNDMEAVGLSG